MEIKCIVTVKELKELLKKETPVAGTTDVAIKLDEETILRHLKNRD